MRAADGLRLAALGSPAADAIVRRKGVRAEAGGAESGAETGGDPEPSAPGSPAARPEACGKQGSVSPWWIRSQI